MITACVRDYNSRALSKSCFNLFIISLVRFCFQFSGLKMRKLREINFLIKIICCLIRLSHVLGDFLLKYVNVYNSSMPLCDFYMNLCLLFKICHFEF